MSNICLLAQSPRVGSTAWYDFLKNSLSNHNHLGEIFNIDINHKSNDEIIELLKYKKNIFVKIIPCHITDDNTWTWLIENFNFITLVRYHLTDIVCSHAISHKNKLWNIHQVKNNYKWEKTHITHDIIKWTINDIMEFQSIRQKINPIAELTYTNLNCNYKKLPYMKDELIENYDIVPSMIETYCRMINFDYQKYGYTVHPE
ncbi:MAG: hypothetical protein WC284_17750 [Candidimonas sp.]